MVFPYIDGKTQEAPMKPLELPPPQRQQQSDPAGYLMDDRLVDAVNVALVLSQPLLLTGEPGTGKTELAHRLGWELGYGPPLVFDTKSVSTARDLFYTFDTMSRFHAAQTGEGSSNNLDYITYNALGTAILLSRKKEDVGRVLPRDFVHDGPRRVVVLVDEVDKAPRDFPNDLLREVMALSFHIAELRNAEVTADLALRPVLVLTSNSERNLPDAFLRRCVFYNIPFPDHARLAAIIASRVPDCRDGARALVDSAIDLFIEVRRQLRRPPSTAELINFIQALRQNGAAPDRKVTSSADAVRKSASTLAKSREDVEELDRLLTEQRVR